MVSISIILIRPIDTSHPGRPGLAYDYLAQMVRTGRYLYDSAAEPPSFSVALDVETDEIPWVPIDPDLPRSALDSEYPLYRHAKPQRVTIREGQALYLPSGWYHHVSQQCGAWPDGTEAPCIAVNYWVCTSRSAC